MRQLRIPNQRKPLGFVVQLVIDTSGVVVLQIHPHVHMVKDGVDLAVGTLGVLGRVARELLNGKQMLVGPPFFVLFKLGLLLLEKIFELSLAARHRRRFAFAFAILQIRNTVAFFQFVLLVQAEIFDETEPIKSLAFKALIQIVDVHQNVLNLNYFTRRLFLFVRGRQYFLGLVAGSTRCIFFFRFFCVATVLVRGE